VQVQRAAGVLQLVDHLGAGLAGETITRPGVAALGVGAEADGDRAAGQRQGVGAQVHVARAHGVEGIREGLAVPRIGIHDDVIRSGRQVGRDGLETAHEPGHGDAVEGITIPEQDQVQLVGIAAVQRQVQRPARVLDAVDDLRPGLAAETVGLPRITVLRQGGLPAEGGVAVQRDGIVALGAAVAGARAGRMGCGIAVGPGVARDGILVSRLRNGMLKGGRCRACQHGQGQQGGQTGHGYLDIGGVEPRPLGKSGAKRGACFPPGKAGRPWQRVRKSSAAPVRRQAPAAGS
jgi:hypothetical protein